MTSSEFEKAAKNAAVKVMREKHGVEVSFENLQLVWFAHELGHKKCTLYAPELGKYYLEVSFNSLTNVIYVDVYFKMSNTYYIKYKADDAIAPA